MSKRFVIIGGDAAGMSAASKAKRENPDLDVIVFEQGEWVSYGACGLPYYIKDEIESLEDLVAIPPEDFREERNIDLNLQHEITEIRPEEQRVIGEAGGEKFEQEYDNLLISTGASAITPPIEGKDLEGVFTLHWLPSGKKIRKYAKELSAGSSVAIVGGGYIGMEMTEAFDAQDLDVHVIEMLPHVLSSFSGKISEEVEEHLDEKDVTLHLDTKVETITGDVDGKVQTIVTEDDSIEVDMVLLAVGVKPNVEIAKQAGIDIGDSGAIATNEYGRTNYPNIYAAGDCAEAENIVTGKPDYIPLALTANRHGRAIGKTVSESKEPVGPIAGTAVTKVFDLEVARTGITDHDQARKAGFEPVTQTITSVSRAHYYPGGHPITITLIADEDSKKIIGASMVGKEGVAKRIDIIATALYSSMTVPELEKLDLSYAPPFGPAWDPVLTAARVLNSKIS